MTVVATMMTAYLHAAVDDEARVGELFRFCEVGSVENRQIRRQKSLRCAVQRAPACEYTARRFWAPIAAQYLEALWG